MNWQTNIQIRELADGQTIPFDLLLLADPSREMIDRYIHRSSILVAYVSEEPVAVYVLYKTSEDTVEIKNIAVVTHLQGKGIGKYLIQHSIEKATQDGFRYITIGTGNSSLEQLYLYQKAGFDIFSLKENFFTSQYPEPIYENGIQCKHMIMLRKNLF